MKSSNLKKSGIWIENTHLRGHRKLWEVSPGQHGQLLLLIFDILRRKTKNLKTLPLKNWSPLNPSNCYFTSLYQPRRVCFCKKSSQVCLGQVFSLEMAWSSNLINVTTQKAEKKKRKKISLFTTIFHLYLDYKL